MVTASSAAWTSIRWLVVAGAPPLAWRPSLVAQAQPPGPGLPEQAPSVHTSRTPAGASWTPAGAGAAAPSGAQEACAHRRPVFEISSPGLMPDEHTPQDAGYLAMSVMTPSLGNPPGPPGGRYESFIPAGPRDLRG